MPRKRKNPRRSELLDITLSELASLIKDLSPQSRVEISYAQYEDEDAHISVFLPSDTTTAEVKRIELALGERCNDILVDTGLFIIGAVCD
jgi:hypothetical protein